MKEVILNIESLAYGGSGIARHEGIVYFVNEGVPGDVVKAKIIKVEKRYKQAEIIEILKESKHRVTPACKYVKKCGGCQWQHIEYGFQLSSKVNELKAALFKVGLSLPEGVIAKAVKSPKKLNYRRTAGFKTSAIHGYGDMKIGFYEEKSNNFIEIDNCLILDEKLNEKLKNIKINNKETIGLDLFLDKNGKVSAFYRFSKKDRGADFSQVNQDVNQLMISYIQKATSNIEDGFSIVDLFCGDGNLSLGFASKASSILGWDYSKKAIARGNINAAKLTETLPSCSISYEAMDINKNWEKIAPKASNADLLILDPPRRGLKKLCKKIISLKIPFILYISCSPPVLARDLKVFTENNYSIEQIKPFDMFPQTYHLETVTILKKRSV